MNYMKFLNETILKYLIHEFYKVINEIPWNILCKTG